MSCDVITIRSGNIFETIKKQIFKEKSQQFSDSFQIRFPCPRVVQNEIDVDNCNLSRYCPLAIDKITTITNTFTLQNSHCLLADKI